MTCCVSGETPDSSRFPTTSLFTVVRAGGLFGKITANWSVTAVGSSPSPDKQLRETSGSVVFPDGSNETQISISSIADDVRPHYCVMSLLLCYTCL